MRINKSSAPICIMFVSMFVLICFSANLPANQQSQQLDLNLAKNHFLSGDLQAATNVLENLAAEFQESPARDSTRGHTYLLLSAVYERQGRSELAAEYYRKAEGIRQPNFNASAEHEALLKAEAAHKVTGNWCEIAPTPMLLQATSVVLMWEWKYADYGRVEYDTDPDFSNPQVEYTWPVRPIHRVELESLTPSTTYYYKVYDSAGVCYNWEDVDDESNKITTAPAVGSHRPFTFSVYGDTRIRSCWRSRLYGTETSIRAVQDFMTQHSPEFVFHLGDLEFTGKNRYIIRRIFGWQRPLWKTSPVVLAYGNHEFMNIWTKSEACYTPNITNTYSGWGLGNTLVDDYFGFQVNYRKVEYGNTLLISLFVPYKTSGAVAAAKDVLQRLWLESTLSDAAASNDFDFIFVGFHRPFVYLGDGDYAEDLYEHFHDIFKQHGVTAVFQACEHNFQHVRHGGIDYFVTGGGGGPVKATEHFDPPNYGRKIYSFSGLNFINIHVDGTQAEYEVYQPYKEVFWHGGVLTGVWRSDRRHGGVFGEGTPQPRPAEMVSPEPESVISTRSVTFEWEAGERVLGYELWIGHEIGGNDIFAMNSDGELQLTVHDLPLDVGELYVTLRSEVDGDWLERYYKYYTPRNITVISPNGYEEWSLDETVDITWTSDGVPGDVRLELYQYGEKLGNIVTCANDGSYSWSVGQYGSTTAERGPDYRVSVVSVSDPSIYDLSDESFSIAPFVMVASPSGGEDWRIGQDYFVEWCTGGILPSKAMNIKLIQNNNRYVGEIETATLNDGSYRWTIGRFTNEDPVEPGNNYYIRVKANVDSETIEGFSDMFSILGSPLPTIRIAYPRADEAYYLSSPMSIEWSTIGIIGNVSVELRRSDDSGGYTVAAATSYNNSPYSYTVPADVAPGSYFVRISNNESTEDSGVFTISQIPAGEMSFSLYPTAASAPADWEGVNDIIGEYDGDKAEGTPTGTAFLTASSFRNWTLPAGKVITKVEYGILARFADGVRGKARMQEVTHSEVQRWLTFGLAWDWKDFDITALDATWTKAEVDALSVAVRRAYDDDPDANLRVGGIRVTVTVDDPSITVTSPSDGVQWELGATREVTWVAQGLLNNLKLTLWQNGTNLGIIGYNINPAAGAYAWTVGQHHNGTASTGDGFTVKIREIGTAVSDISDGWFSIVEDAPPEPFTVTLYPTTVPNVSNWTQESSIIGDYDGNKAEGSPGGTTFLVATSFDNWTLPVGQVITKVEYGVLARFTDGVRGKARMKEVTHNESQRWLTFGGAWSWVDFDVTSLEASWTKAEVDALQVAVRRAYSDDPASANLRVGGIRLKVTVE